MFVRTKDWWRHRRLADLLWGREGGGEMVRALLELDGRPAAYALYRLHFSAARGPDRLHQRDRGDRRLARGHPGEIWRYLLDIDWMARVRAQLLPLDHELFLLLREPRRLSFEYRDGLWVRLVDVEAALNARSYKPGEPVVIEPVDEFCPWNAGRWRAGLDGAERTDAEAELAMPVESLGPAYLGGFSFGELARAGRVVELAEEAPTGGRALPRRPLPVVPGNLLREFVSGCGS